MISRTPTVSEQLYGRLCTDVIGCIACRLDGQDIIDPDASWVAFHHNDKEGSKKPGCHFYAMGLCQGHHQGKAGFSFPARHGQEWRFRELYGTDYELGRKNWEMIAALGVSRRHETQGDVMQFCPFEDIRINAGMPA